MATGPPVACPQGLDPNDCTTIAQAASTNITDLIYEPDTPPDPIDTSVLPPNLQTLTQNCEGDANCKLISYDFNTNTGSKSPNTDYLMQLPTDNLPADKTNITVMAKVGDRDVTSIGIPTDNLDTHFDPNHLTLTPAITTGPIGFSSIGGEIKGTEITNSASTLDGCAVACDSAAICGGFNFSDTSSCTLFQIVDKEAVISTVYNGSSGQTITTLNVILSSMPTGVSTGYIVTGLDSYINGEVNVNGTPSGTTLPLSFERQSVYTIPANTPITIQAPRTIDPGATVHGYISNKDHMNIIGVNGTSTYGYKADFKLKSLRAMPTATTTLLSASPATLKTTPLSLVFSSLPSPLPTISSVTFSKSFQVSQSVRTSSVIMKSDTQCPTPVTAVVSDNCKAILEYDSVNGNTITFKMPADGAYIINAIDSTVRVLFSVIEITFDLADDNVNVPSDRIIGWSGTLLIAPGDSVPVSVIRYTPATITFSFPARSWSSVIAAQTITLSDNDGSTCQDIKACNASIQRLLDNISVRSFSTNDIVACSACPERAYIKPVATQTDSQFTKLREYLWYGNSGVYSCGTVTLPTGSTSVDAQCQPVCDPPSTDTNAVSSTYDGSTNACRITCRTGFYWNQTTRMCTQCPPITPLATNTVFSYPPNGGCAATCSYAGNTPPTNMTVETTTNNGITTACTVSCTNGLPTSDNSQCCPPSTQPIGTKVVSYTSTGCTNVTCDKDSPYGDNYASVGASGATCSFTCPMTNAITLNNGTTAAVNASTGLTSTAIIFPFSYTSSAFTSVSSQLTGDLNTNIGTFTFSPASAAQAMFIGSSGSPTIFYTLTSGPITIAFPVFVTPTSIQYWSGSGGSVSSLVVEVYKNKTGTDSVFNATVNANPYPISTSPIGKQIKLTFAGTGSVAFQIKGKVVQNCVVSCTYTGSSANGGVAIFNDSSRTCLMKCPLGTISSVTGCSACGAVNPKDPGTDVSFNEICEGTCVPTSGQPDGTTTYAGTVVTNPATATTSAAISATATGTARACHIKACPANYTQYTDSGLTTISNGGCCPTPRITNAAGTTVLTGSGIRWSYPVSTATTVAICNLTCSLPSPNTYGMTVSVDNTGKMCKRSCPTFTANTGTSLGTVGDDCNPNCTTLDSNARVDQTYSAANGGIGTCTKTCNSGYKGDTGATPNNLTSNPGTKPCCPEVGKGSNTIVTLSSGGVCKPAGDSICSVAASYPNIDKVVYSAPANATPTCGVQCRTVILDPPTDAGLSPSYSTDGKCTLTCSSTVTNSKPTKSDATDIYRPRCTFECDSGYYKPSSAYLCCENVTQNTGTILSPSTTTCDFTCSLDPIYSSTVYTSTPSGRSCVLGCQSSYYSPSGYPTTCCLKPTINGSGISYTAAAPTADNPCDFTCSAYSDDPLRKVTKVNNISRTGVVNRSCTLTEQCNSTLYRRTTESRYLNAGYTDKCVLLYATNLNYWLYKGNGDVYSRGDSAQGANYTGTSSVADVNPIRTYVSGTYKYNTAIEQKTCPAGTWVRWAARTAPVQYSLAPSSITDPENASPRFTHSIGRNYQWVKVAASVTISCQYYIYRALAPTTDRCPSQYRWSIAYNGCLYIPWVDGTGYN